VERAFAECDLNHEGRLTYEEFKMWIERNPSVLEYIESILPYNGPKDMQPHHHKKETLPHSQKYRNSISHSSRGQSLGRTNSMHEAAGEIFSHTSGGGSLRGRRQSSRFGKGLGLGSLGGDGMDSGAPSPLSPLFGNYGGQALSRNSSFSNHPPLVPTNSANSGSHPVPGRLNASPSIAESNIDNEEAARFHLVQALELTQNSELRAALQQILEALPEMNGMITVDRANTSEVGLFSFSLLIGLMLSSFLQLYRHVVTMEAYLWKKGKSLFHMLSKRYYLLSGNCMYYYGSQSDIRPKGVVFLTGSIIEKIKDDDMELKGYYGFEIVHQDLCTGNSCFLSWFPALFCLSLFL
jgi:hypothetical protein